MTNSQAGDYTLGMTKVDGLWPTEGYRELIKEESV